MTNIETVDTGAEQAATAPWAAHIITLFPEMFPGPLGVSIVGRALANNLWTLSHTQIREFGVGRHRAVDDTPAGGGAGMVMRADVLAKAIDSATGSVPEGASDLPLVYLSPRGEPFSQSIARELASGPGVMMLAGRFEGVDERVIEARQMREISIGDYVLSGGEIAAMVLIDACVRLLPGVLGDDASSDEESFEGGLLEYPQYTKPREWEGQSIPDVLLSGDHGAIRRWRRECSEQLTSARRPDLIRRDPDS